MKRTLFRILAFPLPTRSMRNYVRRLGGPKTVSPTQHMINILSASIDISKIPPSHGFMKYIQQANLKLLNAFDTFAKEHDITYFMIGGAIAGLIRYGACVPWDDDIDVGMTADNYERFINNAFSILPNDEYDLLITSNVFRIIHKKTKAFLDVLRYGVQNTPDCYDPNNFYKINKAQIEFNKITQNKTFIKVYLTADTPKSEISQVYTQIYNQHIAAVKAQHTVFTDVYGKDKTIIPLYTDSKPGEFYSFNTIFPVKRRKFDRYEFSFPADPELYATKCWGDVWKFPSDMFRTHEFTKEQTPQRLLALRKYLSTSTINIYRGFTGNK